MRLRSAGVVLIAGLAAQAAGAACEMPTLVRGIPDGASATEAELLAVQAEVRAYIEAMNAYIACENEAIEVTGPNAGADFLALMSERIRAAREEVDFVATRFNEQVRAFRAARPATGFTPDPAPPVRNAPLPAPGRNAPPGQNPPPR